MSTINILGVKIDKITMKDTINQIEEWIKQKNKKTVFTPNIEIVMAAQENPEFKKILNNSDLSIPDSSRFGWADNFFTEKSPFKKVLIWFTFLIPNILESNHFPVVTGADLMEQLLELSNEKGYQIGLIGGSEDVAIKLQECLDKKYKNLIISYNEPKVIVNAKGEIVSWKQNTKVYQSNIQILFVAFGHTKQEFFINNYKQKIPAKVFIGVGGAFDYLSGTVPRAPKFIRNLALEWLFRLFVQPWRIKRFAALVKFVFLVLNKQKV